MITRRGLLAGILGACAAPAIVTRSGILMPVKTIALPQPWWIVAEFPFEVKAATRQALLDSVRLTSYPGTLRYRATNRYAAR